jgi:hypothetical protein
MRVPLVYPEFDSGARRPTRVDESVTEAAEGQSAQQGNVGMDVVSVIVMEPGSAWPGHVIGSENLVTVGHYDEAGLLSRTRQKLDLLQRRGQRVRVAVLSCNAAMDVASVAGRVDLARALLGAVAYAHFGRLVLAADRPPMQMRYQLVALAGALSLERRATSVCVKLIGRQTSRWDEQRIGELSRIRSHQPDERS